MDEAQMSFPRFSRAASDPGLPPGRMQDERPFERSRGEGPAYTSRSDAAVREWFAAAGRIGQEIDLDISAHSHGAMVRRRGVPAATNLLCLALLYGPGRMPLRLIAERADALSIAHVSEPALLRRLTNAADWLTHLCDALIAARLQPSTEADRTEPSSWHARMAGNAQIMPGHGTPLLSLPLTPQPQDRLQRQAMAARAFIVDFVPWPADLFSDTHVHWLLCVRWTFMSSTLRDPAHPRGGETVTLSGLDRSRMMAHLIAAVISRDD